MGIGKAAKVGLAVIVVIVALIAISAASGPSGPSTTNANLKPIFQGTMQVTSVTSNGAMFSGGGVLRSSAGQVIINPSSTLSLKYGQSVEVKFVYAPTQRLIYDSHGNVTNILSCSIQCSGVQYYLQMQNTALPYYLPLSWNANIGDAVQVTVTG